MNLNIDPILQRTAYDWLLVETSHEDSVKSVPHGIGQLACTLYYKLQLRRETKAFTARLEDIGVTPANGADGLRLIAHALLDTDPPPAREMIKEEH